ESQPDPDRRRLVLRDRPDHRRAYRGSGTGPWLPGARGPHRKPGPACRVAMDRGDGRLHDDEPLAARPADRPGVHPGLIRLSTYKRASASVPGSWIPRYCSVLWLFVAV